MPCLAVDIIICSPRVRSFRFYHWISFMCVPYTRLRLLPIGKIATWHGDGGIYSVYERPLRRERSPQTSLRREGAGHTVDPCLKVRHDFLPVDLVEHLMACVPVHMP